MRIYRISSRGQPKRSGPPAYTLGEGQTTPDCKKNNLLRNVPQSLGLDQGDEIGGVCSTHGRNEKDIQNSDRKT
jgi:hypothetical protein